MTSFTLVGRRKAHQSKNEFSRIGLLAFPTKSRAGHTPLLRVLDTCN